jgi:LysR family transcriptional regulator, nod-box dependent transcriptional activator
MSLCSRTDRIAAIHQRLASRRAMRRQSRLSFRIPKTKQVVQWHKYRSQDVGPIWLRGV